MSQVKCRVQRNEGSCPAATLIAISFKPLQELSGRRRPPQSLGTVVNGRAGRRDEPAGIFSDDFVMVRPEALCQFAFSRDGQKFLPIGANFVARLGVWVGAKAGLFTAAERATRPLGFADFDWVRFE